MNFSIKEKTNELTEKKPPCEVRLKHRITTNCMYISLEEILYKNAQIAGLQRPQTLTMIFSPERS